ncbi:MAG: hypothetical protein Q8L15_18275 [Methylobacter sp.]|nr:hypothetical protein [Methylobacter sp.]
MRLKRKLTSRRQESPEIFVASLEAGLEVLAASRPNGDVANKIGTYMVAVLAQRHGIPFNGDPLSTIDLPSDGAATSIADEVTGFRECQWSGKGGQVRNPAFDVSPTQRVTALITEKGEVKLSEQGKYRLFIQYN